MPKTITFTKKEKKVRPSREQKKELKTRAKELQKYGLALGDISSPDKQNRFFLCFIRALLIFMACFGMIGAVVTSFQLPFSLPIVIPVLFALSFLTAFLYYNKITFYIGYFVLFISFISYSVSFYWYINSGYQAFTNELFNTYSDYFRLLSVREATEYIENRYLTVTAAMIFMGWFFCILLNITISGYMSLTATFLLTFLPLQLAFYIDIVPPLPYLVMLIAVYITVAILGRSGNFTLPYRHDKNTLFDRSRKKNTTHHTYLASSSGMLGTAIYSIILSAVFLLVTGAIFSGDFNSRYISNRVKDTTDRYIKAAVQGGIYSLFNRYNATGGLARGQLGGIGNVSPDFETDLVIRMVPYSSDNVYLKAFTGVTYRASSFLPYVSDTIDAGYLAEKDSSYLPMLALNTDAALDNYAGNSNFYSKMWIRNIDADHSFDYRPYYSFYSTSDRHSSAATIPSFTANNASTFFPGSLRLLDDSEVIHSLDGEYSEDTYELLYLPYSSLLSYNINPSISSDYQEFVYDTYLQVPEDLLPALQAFAKEAGLTQIRPASSGTVSPSADFVYPQTETELSAYKNAQQVRLGIASTLKRYFAANFDYTMSPGTTPRNRDVVEYFLTSQKRGYCAHFASSATMILRSMGIPTRYCEGYLMTLTNIMDGNPISAGTENWVLNNPDLAESGIVEVELPDASAHAWIEIYLDGYGWIPYEMTPPSSEEPGVNLNLVSLFSGLMTQTQRNNPSNTGTTDTLQAADQFSNNILAWIGGLQFLLRPLAILSAALLLFFLLLPLFRALLDLYRILCYRSKEQYSAALLYEYRAFLKKMRKKKHFSLKYPTLREFHHWLSVNSAHFRSLTSDEADTLYEKLQSAAFSHSGLSLTDYSLSVLILQKLHKGFRKTK